MPCWHIGCEWRRATETRDARETASKENTMKTTNTTNTTRTLRSLSLILATALFAASAACASVGGRGPEMMGSAVSADQGPIAERPNTERRTTNRAGEGAPESLAARDVVNSTR
jgi:hypothetical protein